MTDPARQVLTAALRITEGGVAVVRREGGRLLARGELHVRAWSEALDPTTKSWVARARAIEPDRSAEESRVDLQRRIEDLRARR